MKMKKVSKWIEENESLVGIIMFLVPFVLLVGASILVCKVLRQRGWERWLRERWIGEQV